MNITVLKSQISTKTGAELSVLMLNRQFTEQEVAGVVTKVPEPWLSHWDNEKRVRVTLHEDVLKMIKDNPDMDNLAYKFQQVEQVGERLPYQRFVIIIPTSVEATL